MQTSWFSLEMMTVILKVKFQFWSAELTALPFRLFFSRSIKLITLPRAEVEMKVMDEEGEKETTMPLGTWPRSQ